MKVIITLSDIIKIIVCIITIIGVVGYILIMKILEKIKRRGSIHSERKNSR